MSTKSDGGMFAGRISDLARLSEYEIKTSSFLTPAEQKAALDAARAEGADGRLAFWGGAPECERRVAVFLPDWMAPDAKYGGAFDPAREDVISELELSGVIDGMTDFVVAVTVSGSAYAELEHRDYLGAVTALGIERSAVGDIIVTSKSGAVIFATPAAARVLGEELTSVGRERVTAAATPLPAGFRVEREYEAITDTVMSPRLDGIVRALCNISREAASELVARGDVQLNYEVATKPDAEVKRGDVLSVRGYGKYIYDGDRGVNRRGRLRIDARKYV